MLLTGAATRHLFFTGKGGVGKTTVASRIAVDLATSGARTLIVSTDPASNLGDVFEIVVSDVPTAVPGVAGLWIMNIDPEAAAHAYRERVVGPYRGLLPETAVRSMEEQLSGACTVEIAAFNEFTALLSDAALHARFDQWGDLDRFVLAIIVLETHHRDHDHEWRELRVQHFIQCLHGAVGHVLHGLADLGQPQHTAADERDVSCRSAVLPLVGHKDTVQGFEVAETIVDGAVRGTGGAVEALALPLDALPTSR